MSGAPAATVWSGSLSTPATTGTPGTGTLSGGSRTSLPNDEITKTKIKDLLPEIRKRKEEIYRI
jgi:hypothetical protein